MVNHFDERREVVRQRDLLEQSPEDEPDTFLEHRAGDDNAALELRKQMAGALDRASDELREEGDECEEVHEAVRGGNLPPVNIQRVAHGLEGIERDAHRQDDPEQMHLRRHAELR